MRSTSRLSLAAALILLGAAPVLAQTGSATTPAAPATGSTNRPAVQATPANPGGAVTQQGQAQRPAVSGQHGSTSGTHAVPNAQNGQRPAVAAPSASSTAPAAPMGQAPRATN